MADFLVKTLLECRQPVPDFLQDRTPEDAAKLDFNDDSGAEDEEEAETNGAADAWGSGAGDAWGAGTDAGPDAAPASVPEKEGWTGGADAGGSW